MSRRTLLLLLPALVGTTLGLGAAALRAGPSPAEAQAGARAQQSEATPPPSDVAVDTGDAAAQRRARLETRRREQAQARARERAEASAKARAEAERAAAREAEREAKRRERERSDVERVQRRLTELHYYVGAVDGKAGPATVSAVMAFQKVNGLTVDGVIGPQTLGALDDPVIPSLQGSAPDRVEVDLTKQVLYLVTDGELARIVPVSSGSGEVYATAGGGTARALTPVGDYVVERRISGLREAPLGSLYDPMDFYRGWAIHGSNSVPAYPASHGCVRVTRADALWLFDRMPVGTPVSLYGGTHTFAAGSTAAGTSVPAGDTAEEVAEEPVVKPQPGDEDGDKAGDDGDKGDERKSERQDRGGRPPSDNPRPEPTDEPTEEPGDDPGADPTDPPTDG